MESVSEWARLHSSHEQLLNLIAITHNPRKSLFFGHATVFSEVSSSSWTDGMSILTQVSVIVLEAGDRTLVLSSRAAITGGI